MLLSVCVLRLECSGRTFWNFRSGLFKGTEKAGCVPSKTLPGKHESFIDDEELHRTDKIELRRQRDGGKAD